MDKQITMPKLGVTMTEGQITAWRYSVGDYVDKGAVLVEIESDKLVNEYASPQSGVLTEIFAEEGDVVPCGEPICAFESDGENDAGGSADAEATVNAENVVDTNEAADFAPEVSSTPAALNEKGALEKVKAVPMVRKFAKDNGVALANVAATGFGGCVTMDDVRAALTLPPMEAQAQGALTPAKAVPLSGIRGVVAKAMSLSNETAPQGTQFWAIDATELFKLQALAQRGVNRITGAKLSITALLVKALAQALIEFPQLNSIIEDNQILQYDTANIAVAVAVENGLMIPVLHGAQSLSLSEIALKLSRLSEKARSRTLTPEELAGATIVLTNLGMAGARYFTPTLNLPQTVMFGVGKIEDEAVVRDGQIVIRPILPISITVDHRAIDGMPAANFMTRFKELVETPCEERITDIAF